MSYVPVADWWARGAVYGVTDKDAGKGNVGPPDTKTPFERLAAFAKRLLAVPHSEIEQQERAYKKKRKKVHSS